MVSEGWNKLLWCLFLKKFETFRGVPGRPPSCGRIMLRSLRLRDAERINPAWGDLFLDLFYLPSETFPQAGVLFRSAGSNRKGRPRLNGKLDYGD